MKKMEIAFKLFVLKDSKLVYKIDVSQNVQLTKYIKMISVFVHLVLAKLLDSVYNVLRELFTIKNYIHVIQYVEAMLFMIMEDVFVILDILL